MLIEQGFKFNSISFESEENIFDVLSSFDKEEVELEILCLIFISINYLFDLGIVFGGWVAILPELLQPILLTVEAWDNSFPDFVKLLSFYLIELFFDVFKIIVFFFILFLYGIGIVLIDIVIKLGLVWLDYRLHILNISIIHFLVNILIILVGLLIERNLTRSLIIHPLPHEFVLAQSLEFRDKHR